MTTENKSTESKLLITAYHFSQENLPQDTCIPVIATHIIVAEV